MAKRTIRIKTKPMSYRAAQPMKFGWGDPEAGNMFLAPVRHKGDLYIVRAKFNHNHHPAGDSRGGQFESGDGSTASDTSVLFEVAPDPNDKALTARWNKLSDAEKLEVSKAVAADILPEALKAAGTKGQIAELVGGYLGATNPSLAVELDDADKAIPFASLLGHALSQDSMIVLSPTASKGLDEVGVVAVKLPAGERDIGSLTKMYDNLYKIKDSEGNSLVSGFNASHGRMEILNFSDTPTDKLAKLVDKQLGGSYDVAHTNAYSAFIDKKDYANAGSGVGRTAALWRESAGHLRDEAAQAIETELGKRKKGAS